MYDGRDGEASKMNDRTKSRSSSKNSDAVYMMGMAGSPLLREPTRKPKD